MKCLRLLGTGALMALLLGATVAHATVVLTSISVSPNPIGVNDTATITIDGHVNAYMPGQGVSDCKAFQVFFGDVPNVNITDPYKPAASFVQFQPASTANFPYRVTHRYTQVGTYDINATTWSVYHNVWYECGGIYVEVNLDVLGDTIQSVHSITPAVVNQQTSVSVKGLGSCSQDVLFDWGDGSSSTLTGPVDLKMGGIASHTYASTGTKTVTASGHTCSGTATTNISVALLDNPNRVIDPAEVNRLRQRLDRYAQLPAVPARGRSWSPGLPDLRGTRATDLTPGPDRP